MLGGLRRWNKVFNAWSLLHPWLNAGVTGIFVAVAVFVAVLIAGRAPSEALLRAVAYGAMFFLFWGFGNQRRVPGIGAGTIRRQLGALYWVYLVVSLGPLVAIVLLGLSGRQWAFVLFPVWFILIGIMIALLPRFPASDLNPRWAGISMCLFGLAIAVPLALAEYAGLAGNPILLLVMVLFGLAGVGASIASFLRPLPPRRDMWGTS